MLRKVLLSLSLCAVVFLSFWTQAQAEEVLVDSANPPFMFDAQGKAAGIYPAILAEAFKVMNVPVDIKAVPWKRAIAAIDAGEAGVGGIYKNEERLKKYDYSDKLFDEVIQIIVRKGEEFDYKSVASLDGKKVGVLRGWSYGDDFDAAAKAGKLTADEGESDELNIRKLLSKHVDVVLCVKESADAAMSSPEISQNTVALAVPLSSSPSFLAFNKSANKAEVLAKFNEALAKMKADGSLDKLVKANLGAK